eukprot:2018524-Prymnesium_polylepis.1
MATLGWRRRWCWTQRIAICEQSERMAIFSGLVVWAGEADDSSGAFRFFKPLVSHRAAPDAWRPAHRGIIRNCGRAQYRLEAAPYDSPTTTKLWACQLRLLYGCTLWGGEVMRIY